MTARWWFCSEGARGVNCFCSPRRRRCVAPARFVLPPRGYSRYTLVLHQGHPVCVEAIHWWETTKHIESRIKVPMMGDNKTHWIPDKSSHDGRQQNTLNPWQMFPWWESTKHIESRTKVPPGQKSLVTMGELLSRVTIVWGNECPG